MKYLKNKSIVGQHYYKCINEDNILHVNAMFDGKFLINQLEESDLEVLKNAQLFGVFEDESEIELIESNEEEFEEVLRKAIFGLELFEYVKSK